MASKMKMLQTIDEQLGCFGDYNRINPMCSGHCVLRLRCAIQQNHNMRMEMLEEWVAFDGLAIQIQ
jgi:hypothetical protein